MRVTTAADKRRAKEAKCAAEIRSIHQTFAANRLMGLRLSSAPQVAWAPLTGCMVREQSAPTLTPKADTEQHAYWRVALPRRAHPAYFLRAR